MEIVKPCLIMSNDLLLTGIMNCLVPMTGSTIMGPKTYFKGKKDIIFHDSLFGIEL